MEKRNVRPAPIIVTVLCVAMLSVLGFFCFFVSEEKEDEVLHKNELLNFSYALLLEGQVEQAEDLMELYSCTFGYDDECSLFAARNYALQGNYEYANGVYTRLNKIASYSTVIIEEYELVHAKSQADISKLATIRDLKAQGYDITQFGYSEEDIIRIEAAIKVSKEDVCEHLQDVIKESYQTKEYSDVVKYIDQIDSLYAQQETGWLSEENLEEVTKTVKKLKKEMRNEPALSMIATVRNAVLKGNLMLGAYDDIAEQIDVNASYEEIATVMQLYAKGIIKEKDFSDEFKQQYLEKRGVVGEHIEGIFDNLEDSLSKTECDELEGVLDIWAEEKARPALSQMKSNLLLRIEKNQLRGNESKAHLGLAQMYHFLNREELSAQYMSKALASGHKSEDVNYRKAMSKLNSIINSGDDNQDIFNAPEYVEQALDNMLPIELYSLPTEENDNYALNEEKEQEEKPFETLFAEYISTAKNTLSIGRIDISEFETVKATITLSPEYAQNREQLKELLTIYDCGIPITDFTIEKVNYEEIRTFLLCDISGSMSDSMDDLKAAVLEYIDSSDEKEIIAIATFNNNLDEMIMFGASKEELKEFANEMTDGGGTNIYGSLIDVLEMFEYSSKSNNIVIVMTDGADGSSVSEEEMKKTIGDWAEEKDITVNTIGLGDVELDYLSTIAASGYGSFIYAGESVSLETYYELLQKQADNRYVLTYKAQETLTKVNRTLEVFIEGEDIREEKQYSLIDVEYAEADDLRSTQLSIIGLKTRAIYRSDTAIPNLLLGTGFSSDMGVKLKLIGETEYSVTAKYLSENSYTFEIPAGIAVGSYDVEVLIGNERGYIKCGLTVVEMGPPIVVEYGGYVFTAMGKEELAENEIRLFGNVTMNDWLCFKGDLIIQGDLEKDAAISVTDKYGSSIVLSSEAIGLADRLVSEGVILNIPKLGKFELYYDLEHLHDFEEYKVDEIGTTEMRIVRFVTLEGIMFELYPDRLEICFSETNLELPELKELFDSSQTLFDAVKETRGKINNHQIGITFEYEKEFDKKKSISFLDIAVGMKSAKISIDTYEDVYHFGGAISFLSDGFSVGLWTTLKGTGDAKLVLDGLKYMLDIPLTVNVGPVPVTFSEFSAEASNIAEAWEKKNFTKLKIKGSMDVAACDIDDIMKSLKPFIGDVSLLKADDASIELNMSPSFSILANTKLFFLEIIQIAEAEVQFGQFDYSLPLLQKEMKVIGFRAMTAKGFACSDIDILKIDVSGGSEIDLMSRFVGFQITNTHAKVDVFDLALIDGKCDALIGIYFKENGEPQFTIAAEVNDGNQRRKIFYTLNKEGRWGENTTALD